MLRIAIAQINATVGDLSGNEDRILTAATRARERGADLVLFPELAVCGYPPEDLLLKDYFVRDSIKTLRSLTKKIHGITAVVGFVDIDRQGNLYNAAAVIAKKKICGIYHKQFLPNYGVFDEKRYFTPGQNNPVFFLDGVPFAVSICEDFWVDEVAAGQAKAGARVLFNLSASPYDYGKLTRRMKVLSSHARQHQAWVCYCNLVGGQDELVFDGTSAVIDPRGKPVVSGREFEEDLVVADIDVTGKKRQAMIDVPGKLKADRGIPEIADSPRKMTVLERVFAALILGTRDYVRKNGFEKVVVGLSGGIDSSLVAAIACEAIGRQNVIGITMPSTYTSEGTHTDARALGEALGIRLIERPIHDIYESYLASLSKDFPKGQQGVAEENIQARIRGNILMAYSNKFGWLVLTTGNKSEVAVGYCTLYGDMSGGFAVIKDVPKTMVYDLAALVNQKRGQVIPQSIIDRPPTAELRENQRDDDSLPPYDQLDPLLKGYVEDHWSLAQLGKKEKDKAKIKQVISLVDKSEYKRRQSPPGIKITPRAFGKDWRLPITNKYKEF